MTTTKEFIKNRKGQKLAVLVEGQESQKGLTFVMHGLGGFKEQPHIQTFAQAFLDNGYTVMRFDTTNNLGESEGKYEEGTTTTYYEDLEDAISWAKLQSWYQEPFVLAGHSLGGLCIALYAENNPEKVKALAPISTVISGKLNFEARSKESLENWEKIGWQVEESVSKPGAIKRTPWSLMQNLLQYDLVPNVDKLTMPVLLIVGEQDTGTPLVHQQILYDGLPGKKEIHIIKGVDHNFRRERKLDEAALKEIESIFDKWVKSL